MSEPIDHLAALREADDPRLTVTGDRAVLDAVLAAGLKVTG